MKRKLKIGAIFLIVTLCLASRGWAQHQHGSHQTGGPASGGEKKAEASIGNESSPTRTFILTGSVKASFSILPMDSYKKMLQEMKMKIEVDPQSTHNISVSLTDARSNLSLNEAIVKMKVISPRGKEQTKILDQIPAMNQYAGEFTMAEKGRYQILLLFKSGGEKKAVGFYYRLK